MWFFIFEEFKKEEKEVVKRLPPSGLSKEQRNMFKNMLNTFKKDNSENNRDNYRWKSRNNNFIVRKR